MEWFAKLFGSLLVFVYHCFDRIVIHGYLSGLSRPEQVVYFFREVVGVAAVTKEVLSGRTGDYQGWVEAFARNHEVPIEWAEKGVRKEEYVRRWQRSMERRERFGAYFIFKRWSKGQASGVRSRSIRPTTRITASSHRSAPALPTTTSIFGMESWAPS